MGRKNFYLVLDVETANTTEQALVYDIGFAVIDRLGIIQEKHSYIVSEIFFDEKNVMNNAELMASAYYSKKLPQYYEGMRNGTRIVSTLSKIRWHIMDIIDKYKIVSVCAYNSAFDISALNTTLRYITKSQFRYFFPYSTTIWCIQHMACQVICDTNEYRAFCTNNKCLTDKGYYSTSAETVWKYLTKNIDFEESHTGLEDVEIECEIMAKCLASNKKIKKGINRGCWWIPQDKKNKKGNGKS